ncbi:BACON domain-containing protein [Myroides sp. LoEW2-1]|uniref:BACON domain-containing protein n=1 Tax=Myroides sp. LoEW2-1 TaxID=2683192 RepID=UPI001322B00F|nr:BACON domain-containing protein [Myroides sp. LoEW2-1]MVX36065.1 hypothetical protein [Myroides sp. LoEW2-1]
MEKGIKQLILPWIVAVFSLFVVSCSQDDSMGGFAVDTPELKIDQSQFSVDKNSGEIQVNIQANLPWRLQANQSWVTPSVEQGEKGSHTVKLAYTRNTSLEARTAEVVVWISDQSKQTIELVQGQATLEDTYNNYYVSEQGSGDGSSWQEATSLSKALELAVNQNDVIHIEMGEYHPDANALIDSEQKKDYTFLIQANIKLIGGYPKNATKESKPSVENKTILSGSDSSVHVVSVIAPKVNGLQVVLENLTITKGLGDQASSKVNINGFDLPRDHGAGLIVMQSNLVLEHCEVVYNNSGRHAAGIYIAQDSNVVVNHSKVNHNTGSNANSNAGGIFVSASKLHMNFSEVSFNQAGGVSGGIQSLNYAEVNLVNTIVSNNKARANGGGFYHRGGSKSLIVNSYFYNNEVTDGPGGAISNHDATSMHMISSTIYANSSSKDFSGVNNQNGNSIYMYNSLLFDNYSANGNIQVNPQGELVISKSAVVNKVYDQKGGQVALFEALDLNTTDPLKVRPASEKSPIANFGFELAELTELKQSLQIDTQAIELDLDNQSRDGKKSIGAFAL